jgi:hypothetical protein
MRRILQIAAAVGAVLLAAGVVWAYLTRESYTHAGVTTVLALGTLLAAGSLLATALVERRADGLELREGESLPAPYVAPVLGLVAACDLVGGAYASRPMAVVGVALLATALVGVGLLTRRPTDRIDRGTVVAARRLRAFAEEHRSEHGRAAVVVEHVGRGLTRLVVVGGDGAFGDVLVRDSTRAERAVQLSGLPTEEATSRELAGRIRTGHYEWERMAGLQLGGRRAGR